MDDDGNLCPMTPTKTFWYSYYILNDNVRNIRAKEKNCRQFWLPHEQFCQLLKLLKEDKQFWQWRKGYCDSSGTAALPLSLLLFGSLRYLRRGWTFDNTKENTAISKEVYCVFSNKFIDYCSATLFDKYVIAPTNAQKTLTHMIVYTIAGMSGCVPSTNKTNIAMSCCLHHQCHIYKEYNLNFSSCTYNLLCNHRQHILYTTSGHPASWNNKNLQ